MRHKVQGARIARRQRIVQHGCQIIDANLMPAEFPEICCIRMNMLVLPGIRIASCIAQPDIVARVGEHVSQRSLWPIDDPIIRGGQYAVLQKHHRLLGVLCRLVVLLLLLLVHFR